MPQNRTCLAGPFFGFVCFLFSPPFFFFLQTLYQIKNFGIHRRYAYICFLLLLVLVFESVFVDITTPEFRIYGQQNKTKPVNVTMEFQG